MSPEAYGWETREAAEELYILEGLSFEQVAGRSGVSIAQLKRWSADSDPSWPDRRREYRRAQIDVRQKVALAKLKLIEAVLGTGDPQKAYAFSALVESGKTVDEEARKRIGLAMACESRGILTAAEALSALREAVQLRLNAMLSRPGELSLGAIKEIGASLEAVERLKSTYKPAEEEAKGGGLSDEAAEAIRSQILGLIQ